MSATKCLLPSRLGEDKQAAVSDPYPVEPRAVRFAKCLWGVVRSLIPKQDDLSDVPDVIVATVIGPGGVVAFGGLRTICWRGHRRGATS